MFTHTPICYNCCTREVAGEFSYPDGSGFCSAKCEAEAQTEAADHADKVALERAFEGFPAIVIQTEVAES